MPRKLTEAQVIDKWGNRTFGALTTLDSAVFRGQWFIACRCGVCGRSFHYMTSVLNRNRKHCSIECRDNDKRRNQK